MCLAAQRQLTAAWLSLAAILVAQLNPPVFALNLRSGPVPEAEAVVNTVLPLLMQCGLQTLGVNGAMEAVGAYSLPIQIEVLISDIQNPDIVQEFFSFMDRVIFFII